MPESISTLVQLLRFRASHHPHQIAYTFLQDGEVEQICWTYQELDQRARAIASRLQSITAAGERAVLLYPPGLEFVAAFWGCLYAKVIAVPAYPPRRNQHLSRLQAILTDAGASVALTTSSLTTAQQWLPEAPILKALQWLATDTVIGESGMSQLGTEWQEPEISGDTLAFLQYTSGSTGTPKGVMVSHQNLLHNSADLDLVWEHTAESAIVTWLPTFHDMRLVYGVIQPLYRQIPCYMMAPVSFLQRPMRWLQAISKHDGEFT